LHTNFSLDKDGEYLALVKPDGSTIASEYPIGNGLQGDYYQWTNAADVFNSANLKFSRIDATVNFSWNGAAPDPALTGDHFAVRWTGKVKPVYTEAYTFTTVSDDGVRLWVNNQLLVDHWTSHTSAQDSGTIVLNANTPTTSRWSTTRRPTPRRRSSSGRAPTRRSRSCPRRGFSTRAAISSRSSPPTFPSAGAGHQHEDPRGPGHAGQRLRAHRRRGRQCHGMEPGGLHAGRGLDLRDGQRRGFEANVAGFAFHTYLSAYGMGDLTGAENTVQTSPATGAHRPTATRPTPRSSISDRPAPTALLCSVHALSGSGSQRMGQHRRGGHRDDHDPAPGTYTFDVDSDDGSASGSRARRRPGSTIPRLRPAATRSPTTAAAESTTPWPSTVSPTRAV